MENSQWMGHEAFALNPGLIILVLFWIRFSFCGFFLGLLDRMDGDGGVVHLMEVG
jgi:hypothetical protein